MKIQKLKDSGGLVGKTVHIVYEGNDGDNSIDAVIDVMEEGGVFISYYTEEEDINNTSPEADDECTVFTQCFIPWSSVHCIEYRSDEYYP